MLAVVTATVNRQRAEPCFASWRQHAAEKFPFVIVENGTEHGFGEPYLGPVAAFRIGIERALREASSCELIACFHDDLVILDQNWDAQVEACFAADAVPSVGLVSFDGFTAVGDQTLYHAPYNPDQLTRCPLSDEERPQPLVAPADFCIIGRRAFWSGFTEEEARTRQSRRKTYPRPWAVIDDAGMIDHCYDVALGCLARRGGWRVWYLPVRYRHLGGQTTLHDSGYQLWVEAEFQGGDRAVWEQAHRIGYEIFKDTLPLRLD